MAQSAAPKHESPRRATYQDVLDAPAHLVAEIINGTLHTHPRPASRHALATSNLGDELVSPFGKGRGGPGGWWIIDEPELHFDDEIVVPDLAGWRRERMPEYPDTAYFTLAPDWVCEALSPSTRKVDLHEKRPIYALAGVPPPVARRPDRSHSRGVRAPRRAMAVDREREGRRTGEHPSVRCDHLQPWRSLALRGARTAPCLNSLARIAMQGTVERGSSPSLGENRPRSAGFQGGGAPETEFTYCLNLPRGRALP